MHEETSGKFEKEEFEFFVQNRRLQLGTLNCIYSWL